MLSIYAYFGYSISPEERFALIKKYFRGVAVWRAEDFRLNSFVGEHQQDELLSANNLKVSYAHAPIKMTPYLNNSHYYRKETIKIYKQWIRGCKERNIPILVIHAENLTEAGIENIRELADFATEDGVKLAVENTVGTAPFDALFAAVPNVYFCYDSCHAAMNKDLKGNMIEKYADRLIATNLSDGDGHGDVHLLPGDGECDWESIARKLRDAKYKGDYTLEIFGSSAISDPDEYLRIAQDRMKNYFAL